MVKKPTIIIAIVVLFYRSLHPIFRHSFKKTKSTKHEKQRHFIKNPPNIIYIYIFYIYIYILYIYIYIYIYIFFIYIYIDILYIYIYILYKLFCHVSLFRRMRIRTFQIL